MFWAINLTISVTTLKLYDLYIKLNLLKIATLSTKTYAILFSLSQCYTCVQYSQILCLHITLCNA